MKTENWVKESLLLDYQKQAKKLSKKRAEWEQEQRKQGKKEVLVPHPTSPRAYIIKYV